MTVSTRFISFLAFLVAGIVTLYTWGFGPDKTLSDYEYTAWYRDGGSEVRVLDSVSYHRDELLRGGWKFVYSQYVNGSHEGYTDYVTRCRLRTIRTYPNDTPHYRRYTVFLNLTTALTAVSAAIFLWTLRRRTKE